MSEIKDGGPAFPCAEDHKTADSLPWTAGMSLRDYFAAAAIQPLVQQGIYAPVTITPNPEEIARRAYLIADAMLKAREAKP